MLGPLPSRSLALFALASVMFTGCVALSSCSRATGPTIEPGTLEPLPVDRQPDHGSVIGRVVLGGKPVPYFGVIFSPNYMMSIQSKPFAIHSRDGRFVINGIPAGSWDIMIVAPHFGTFIAPGHEVAEGSVLDLGDILMTRGPTIGGHVTDPDGRPVANAKVRIITSRLYPLTDELSEMSLGNFETRSDKLGAYRFDGVTSSELAHFSSSMVATFGTLHSSEETAVPHANATIDLVVRDAGAIDGVVDFETWPGANVVAQPVSRRGMARYAQVGADRRFRFDNVQPDVYEVQLVPGNEAVPLLTRVAVTAGERRALAIVAPDHTVTVAIQVTGHTGALVELTPIGVSLGFAQAVAMKTCSADGTEISGVTPARYRACVASDCKEIEVLPAPSRQVFELGAARKPS